MDGNGETGASNEKLPSVRPSFLFMLQSFARNHKVVTTLGVCGVAGSTLLLKEDNRFVGKGNGSRAACVFMTQSIG